MKRRRFLALLLVLAALPVRTPAQPLETQRRDRARTFLVVRIADALKLPDEQALKVSSVIRESDERRQQLVKQREAVEDTLRASLSKQPADSAELTKAIAEGNDIDQKIALVPEETFRELQKVLSVEQQAKLMLLRRELQGEVRRAMQLRRPGGARRGAQARSVPGAPPPGN